MDKGKLHHLLVRLRPVSYWYFLIVFVIFTVTTVFALRHNNLTAIYLRNQVYAADKNGTDVTGALNNLREYVYSHMNTNLASPGGIYPPIQLQNTYLRLEQNALAQATTSTNANAGLYTAAENYCQKTNPNGFSGRYRIPCIDSYITQNGVKAQPIAQIPTSLYEFDFQAPFWSPDLAGFSLVFAVLFFVLFVVRFGFERWLRHQLKEHA